MERTFNNVNSVNDISLVCHDLDLKIISLTIQQCSGCRGLVRRIPLLDQLDSDSTSCTLILLYLLVYM